MDKAQILDILRETNVMLEGHFLLTSGRHSDKYMQCAHLFMYPNRSAQVCADIAANFSDKGVTMVVGPAVGGIIIAYEVAKQLNVPTIFAERENGKMAFRRGFEVPKGAKVLVTEDVVTTGGSVMEVIELIKAAGAEVVGVAVVVDRSNGKVDFGVPFYPVLAMEVISYEAENCPLCAAGAPPAVKPGSRALK